MEKPTPEQIQKFLTVLPIERLITFESSHLKLIDSKRCPIWNMEVLMKCYYDNLASMMEVNPEVKNDEEDRKVFNMAIVHLSPSLKFMMELLSDWEVKYESYLITAARVGVVVVDEGFNFVALVEAYGYAGAWSFAKSKKEPWKSYEECAVDECLEELGLPVAVTEADYVEKIYNQYIVKMKRTIKARTRLYYIFGVSMNTSFKAKTRKEVQNSAWFRISYLAKSSEKKLQKELKFRKNSAKVIKCFAGEIYKRCEQKKTELIGNHPQYEGENMVNKQSLVDETS